MSSGSLHGGLAGDHTVKMMLTNVRLWLPFASEHRVALEGR